MEEMLPLFNWLFSTNGTFTEIFVGKKQPLQRTEPFILESRKLVERYLEDFKEEPISSDMTNYQQIVLFLPNSISIIENFQVYREKMKRFINGPIFVSQNLHIAEKDTKELVKIGNKTQIKELSKQSGTIVICKIHPIVLGSFLRSFNGKKIFKSKIIEFKKELRQMEKMQHSRFDFFEIKKSDFKNARIVGQFNRQFIILIVKNSLFVIDQHALHERIMLEKLLTKYRRIKNLEKAKEKACKNAIKFNDRLRMIKMNEMVQWIEKLKRPFICCHGRPSIIHIFRFSKM
ncbi:putative MutL, dimerization, DNA mismatch repair protein [Pseudoloma neurophilia]|uniref:Putative MutL, dimerization, DNA mismatch repair protein n=1 Tax=Pseudoloma neurophilia TaxID=146866 RepID=A0A0R0LYK4_9MICR|nr:putative MutL, dimerization, DNA mismatch repair protein [Pseudoloma neurophilia]